MMPHKWYFVSLAYYGHRVFKCRGFGAEDLTHLAFYKPHFERYGNEGQNPKAEKDGPYRVLILDTAVGGLCAEDGRPLTLTEAIREFGAGSGGQSVETK